MLDSVICFVIDNIGDLSQFTKMSNASNGILILVPS